LYDQIYISQGISMSSPKGTWSGYL
jgi:hypothetical protein